MRQANIKFTYHDYLQLPDDKRYELVEGELFLVPSPTLHHQKILRNLLAALHAYSRQHGLGEVFQSPCDVVLSEISVLQPDLLFVSSERMGILTEANIQGAPDLVVEILSPSTRQRDLGIKRNVYAKYGVCEYWIIDPESKTVEILSWAKDGYCAAAVVSETDLLSTGLFPGMELDLAPIFR